MDHDPLHARLMEDARRYDPAAHARNLLAPYRDVLLVCRAKFMSYEQIAATLTSHGLKVSPAAVGIFCRKQFTKGEILRERAREPLGSSPAVLPVPSASRPPRPAAAGAGRGPRIARDDY